MCQQPAFVQAVDQVFVAVEVLLPAKEHVQADALAFLVGVLISLAKQVDALLPGQIPGNGGVAAEKVVGNNDAGVAQLLVGAGMGGAGGGTAGAALAGVHMRFV